MGEPRNANCDLCRWRVSKIVHWRVGCIKIHTSHASSAMLHLVPQSCAVLLERQGLPTKQDAYRAALPYRFLLFQVNTGGGLRPSSNPETGESLSPRSLACIVPRHPPGGTAAAQLRWQRRTAMCSEGPPGLVFSVSLPARQARQLASAAATPAWSRTGSHSDWRQARKHW